VTSSTVLLAVTGALAGLALEATDRAREEVAREDGRGEGVHDRVPAPVAQIRR